MEFYEVFNIVLMYIGAGALGWFLGWGQTKLIWLAIFGRQKKR